MTEAEARALPPGTTVRHPSWGRGIVLKNAEDVLTVSWAGRFTSTTHVTNCAALAASDRTDRTEGRS